MSSVNNFIDKVFSGIVLVAYLISVIAYIVVMIFLGKVIYNVINDVYLWLI